MTHTPTRRLLALLLAVATVFSLLSMSVSAADEQTGPEIELVNTATEPLKKDSKFHVAVKIKDSTFAFSNFGIYLIFDTEALNLDQIITAYVNSEGEETDYLPNLTGNTKQVVHEGVTYGGVVQMASGKNVKPKKQTLFILEFSAKKCLTAPVEVTLHVDTFQSVNDDNTFTDYTPQITPAQITISHTLTAVPAKDATCTEDGNTAYWKCSACEKWFSDENGTTEITDKDSVVTKATGHQYQELTDEKYLKSAATCTSPAIYYKSCSVCGATSTETFEYGEKAAHSYVQQHDAEQHWDECSVCHARANEAAHSGGTATCIAKAVCSVCHTEYGALADHDTVHHDRVDPTCTTTGSIEYWQCGVCGKKFSDAACTTEVTDVTLDKLPHSAGTAWEKDTTYHWHLCVNCESEVMDKAAHTYGDWVVITEATETETGLRKRTCSVCGYETIQPIPAGTDTGEEETPAKPAKKTNTVLLVIIGVLAVAVIAVAVILVRKVLLQKDEEDSGDDEE